MRGFSNDPNVIIAIAMTPNVDSVSEIFRRGSLRLRTRLSPVRDDGKRLSWKSLFTFMPATTLSQADIRVMTGRTA